MNGDGDLGSIGGGATGIGAGIAANLARFPGTSVLYASGSPGSRFSSAGTTYMGNFTGGGGGIGSYSPMGMSEFSPYIPSPVAPVETQPTFGQKAGETIKNFLKRLARVHPATATAAFAFDFVKNLQNAENPQDFVKGMLGQLAMRKVGSNLGITPMARAGIGTLQNVRQGRMTPGQGIASLGTSAAFQKAAPSILKSAYDKGGMNAVYGVATLLGMARQGLQKNIIQPGPGGDG
jgi:hypothetical protein